MRIDVHLDQRAFQQGFADVLSGNLHDAGVEAINIAAGAAKAKLREVTGEVFDAPTDYTLNAFGVLRARNTDADPAALVSIMKKQAAYLSFQVFGGVRQAGDYATTKLGPLIPGPDGETDSHGNLPRDYVRQQLEDPNVFWKRLDPDHPPALVRKVRDDLQVLAWIARFEFYGGSRLPFYDVVEKTVLDVLPWAIYGVLKGTGTARAYGDTDV